MLAPPPRSYASGIFPYAMVAAMAWPELGRFVPPDALLVFIFIFALMPWAGLAPPSADALLHVRAFVAGIFLYMAAFEFAPPHAHGRTQSLGRLGAFCAGLALAWLAEACARERWVAIRR